MHKNIFKRYCKPLAKFAAACVSVQCSLCSYNHKISRINLCPQCLHVLTAIIPSGFSRCVKCAVLLPNQMENACLLNLCNSCESAPGAYSYVITAFDYLPPGDMLIHKYKVQRQFGLASGLAALLATAVNSSAMPLPEELVIVPVPSSRQAILRRGFNPAAELAKPLARYLNLPYKPDLLRRVHNGQKQAQLNREQRMISTAHLYSVHGCVKGTNIAVVDDVLTTGATLHNIARLFKRDGAASVCGFVLARTPT